MSSKKNKRSNKKKVVKKKTRRQEPKWLLWLGGIMLLTFLAYIPGLQAEFLIYDDDLYIFDNPWIQNFDLNSVAHLFTNTFGNQYSPVAMSIMGIEFQLFGLNELPYRLVSLLLHLGNVYLVFLLGGKLFPRKEYALIAAGLFAINPIQIESVLWLAASMKVGTFTLFFLASLIFYARYLEEDNRKFYGLSLLLFVLSCCCKEQAVTLAPTLLLIDFLKDRKLLSQKVILEKAPFFILAIVFGLVTLAASSEAEANVAIKHFNLGQRMIVDIYSVSAYWVKAIFPFNLSFMYFYPKPGGLPIIYYVSILPFLGLLGWFIYTWIKGQKLVAFALGFFLINTGLNLVAQLSAARDTMMADRYIYLSSLGIFLIIAYAWMILEKRSANIKRIGLYGLLAYGLMLGILTFMRSGVWQNSITLFTDVIEKQKTKEGKEKPHLFVAYYNRAIAKKAKNDIEGTLADYNLAIAAYPHDPISFTNRGNIYFGKQQYDLAIADYNKSISLEPSANAFSSRGAAYGSMQQYNQAIQDLSEAIKLDPELTDAYSNRMLMYMQIGQNDLALSDCNSYLQKRPQAANILSMRGKLHQALNRLQEAESDFTQAINLDPNDGGLYLNRAYFFYATGRNQLAQQDAQQAQSLGTPVDQNFLNSLQ